MVLGDAIRVLTFQTTVVNTIIKKLFVDQNILPTVRAISSLEWTLLRYQPLPTTTLLQQSHCCYQSVTLPQPLLASLFPVTVTRVTAPVIITNSRLPRQDYGSLEHIT